MADAKPKDSASGLQTLRGQPCAIRKSIKERETANETLKEPSSESYNRIDIYVNHSPAGGDAF